MAVPTARLEAHGREVKLGRNSPTPDMVSKALPLGQYVKRYGGKPPPAKVDWYTKASKALGEMLGNDQYGNCVVVAELHGIGAWSANEPGGKEVVATTQEAVAQYKAICGPGDNGCYIPRVLDHFRDNGLVANGKRRKIDGYVRVNPRDQLLVKIALHLFGGLHLGINWPRDWMSDARPGGVLRPTTSPIIGGHAVRAVGYDDTGLMISTWGILCHLSWEALSDPRFVDENYAALGDDWYDEMGATAAGAGVNVTKLRDDLRVIAGGGTPDIPNDEPEPPLPPAPVDGDAVWEWLKNVDVLGFTVHLHAALYRKKELRAAGASWWDVVILARDLFRAVVASDWQTAIARALDLVALLTDLLGPEHAPRALDFLRGVQQALGKYRAKPPAKELDATPPVA